VRMPQQLVAEAKPFEEYNSLKGFALIKLHYIVLVALSKRRFVCVSGDEMACYQR